MKHLQTGQIKNKILWHASSCSHAKQAIGTESARRKCCNQSQLYEDVEHPHSWCLSTAHTSGKHAGDGAVSFILVGNEKSENSEDKDTQGEGAGTVKPSSRAQCNNNKPTCRGLGARKIVQLCGLPKQRQTGCCHWVTTYWNCAWASYTFHDHPHISSPINLNNILGTESLQAGLCGDRIPVSARFSVPVQTGPGA
jgi:hypothetical protein